MDYPIGFPEHLKDDVDSAFAEAEIQFFASRKSHPSSGSLSDLIVEFVSSVYLAFAKQVARARTEGLWSGEKCRDELRQYLFALSRHVSNEKNPDSNNYRVDQIWRLAKEKIEASEGWVAVQEELKQAANPSNPAVPPKPVRAPSSQFPNRAKWLKDRLKERGWDWNRPYKEGGPDRKTVKRILDGLEVHEDTLDKIVTALNKKKVGAVLSLLSVPTD